MTESTQNPSMGLGTTDVGISSVTTDTNRRDIRYEVLDMNSQGMYLCQQQQLDEAEAILTQAYNVLETDSSVHDAQTLDQLRSTTLNNLGVVECHKGLHKQALNHLEVAQTLEHQWNVHSASVSLNICAACNALGMHDRATSAALDTIEMLRQAVKRDSTQQANTAENGNQGDQSALMSTTGSNAAADSAENNVLWGAAWHNLAVAQLNSASGKDLSEYTNVLALFSNAMESTTALLGREHPMTRAVHESYRAVRQHLREAGAFKQHRSLLTCELPPITGKVAAPDPEPGMTVNATSRKHATDFHLTLRGKETGGKKVVERYNSEAFPAQLSESGRQRNASRSPRASPRATITDGGNTARSTGTNGSFQKRATHSPVRGIPLSGNLLAASTLYRNPHPLLLHPRLRPVDYIPRAPGAVDTTSARAGNDAQQVPSASPPKHREQLSEDMWVEAISNLSTSPRRQPNPANGARPARPVYSQQLYALDAVSADQHRVNQPVKTAHAIGDKPKEPVQQ